MSVPSLASSILPSVRSPRFATRKDAARRQRVIVPSRLVLSPSSALSETQQDFTAERISGFNRNMIEHIFSEVDDSGNGLIELEELDFLAEYLGETWDAEYKQKLFKEIDADGSGAICTQEFYDWFIMNCVADDNENSVAKMREERLSLGLDQVPQEMLDLLQEHGTDQIKQECTHPLHDGHGRMLRDHLISTYLLLKAWGEEEFCVNAGMFHAVYERADGMRTVDFKVARPVFQKAFGKDTEELMFLFPSAHKSIYKPNGLLHAPLGSDFEIIDFSTGEPITFPDRLRRAMCNLEFVNGYDQSFLDCTSPVRNLWAYYQHANILPIVLEEAQKIILKYKELGQGATVADIVEFHESRYTSAGKDIKDDPKWDQHVDMFRPGGKYFILEQKLTEIFNEVDDDGSGELDFDEVNQLFDLLDETSCEEERRAIFNKMDLSGDGTIDRHEYELYFIPKFNAKFL